MNAVRLDHLPSSNEIAELLTDQCIVNHWKGRYQTWILPDLWNIVLSYLWTFPFTYSLPWKLYEYDGDCMIPADGVADFWCGTEDGRSCRIGLGYRRTTISGHYRFNLRSMHFCQKLLINGHDLEDDTHQVFQLAKDRCLENGYYLIWTDQVKETFTNTEDLHAFILKTNYKGHVLCNYPFGTLMRIYEWSIDGNK